MPPGYLAFLRIHDFLRYGTEGNLEQFLTKKENENE